MFSNTLKELLTFFRSPQENIAQAASQKSKIKTLVSAYLIFLLPVLLSTSFFILAQHFGVINEDDHKLIDMLGEAPVALTLFLVVVMAPLWEELIFRLPLRWERAYIFQIFLSPLRLGGKVVYENALQSFHAWWQKKYAFVFYFTVLAFGFIHIANFQSQSPLWKLLIWAPVLVLPQILLGGLLGFIRLRLGFWWSVLLHASHNFIFVGMALLAQVAETANMEVHQTDNYRLAYQWYDAGEAPERTNNQIKPREVIFEKISVDDLFRFLVNNDSSRYQSTDSTGEKLLKLEFRTKVSTLDLKRLLVQALEEHTDLKLERSRQSIDAYEVIVENPDKLASYEQGPEEGSQINVSPDSLIYKYTNLKKITANIQKQHWDRVLRYAGDDYNLYEIRLANTAFDELEDKLSERYGLLISEPRVDTILTYSLK